MPEGTVKWFSEEKGYGFIERPGDEPDVFAHFSKIEQTKIEAASGAKRNLREGQRVEFDISMSPKGPMAESIRVLS
jgi:CspA family cold shock protein